MKRWLLFTLVAAFLVGPRLRGFDLHTAAAFGLALLGLYALTLARPIPMAFRAALLAVFPFLLYTMGVSAVYGAADLTGPWLACKALIYLLAAYAILQIYLETHERVDVAMLRHAYIICAIDALFVLVVIVSPSFRGLAAAYLDLSGKEHWVSGGYRGFDMSLGGGAIAAMVFATALIAGLGQARHLGPPWFVVISAFVLLAGVFFTGRTGLVVTALGIGVLCARALFFSKEKLRRSSLAIIAGFFGMAAGAAAYIALSASEPATHIRESVVPWALEGILESEGNTENRSLSKITGGMYMLPDADSVVIFGSSNSGRSERLPYLPSDIGYVRLIFAAGIVGLVLLIASYLPMGTLAYRMRGSVLAFPVAFALLVHVVANFKELFVVHRAGGALLALWFVGLAHEAHKAHKGHPAQPMRIASMPDGLVAR